MNVEELVSALTLEEKAGLCSGADFWHTKAVERLGIPAIKVSDGPHGLRTQKEGSTDPNDAIEAVCFPAGCAAAASFDPALTRRMGAALGREARASGVQVLLGPAVNIKRSPLCGRNFEYYSEDPYLAGELAAGFIQGVQSEGVGTSIKHFAANSQETRRLSADSRVDERTLHEIYLPAFETAVKKARPWTVMCSYNRVNGDYASENKPLLTDILRDDWGFDGFVMSDWGAVNDRVKGVAAGLELEMPGSGGVYDRKIIEAVQNGTLDIGVLDKAVARILNIVLRAADLAKLPAVFDHAADHKLAVELAKQSAVLLRNLGALPLHKGQKVAYIGAFADHPRYQGGGSSHVNTTAISAMDAAIMNDRSVSYIEGFPADRDQRDEAEFLRAVTAAEAADVAVIFAGLPDSFESEGADRRHMRLPDCQRGRRAEKHRGRAAHRLPGGMPLGGRCIVCFVYVPGGRGRGRGRRCPAVGRRQPLRPPAGDLAPAAGGHALLPGLSRRRRDRRLPRGRLCRLPLVRRPQNAGALALRPWAELHRVRLPECRAEL